MTRRHNDYTRPLGDYTCPNGCDLHGPSIPKESRQHYSKDATHFSRMIGVEIPGLYDGVCYWMCPDCGERWHRFADGRVYDAVQKEWERDLVYQVREADKGTR